MDQVLEKVRNEGVYPPASGPTRPPVRPIAGLGRQLTGDARMGLSACLPLEAARVLTVQIPDTQPLGGWAFVEDFAARSGALPATARWGTGSVFAAVAAPPAPTGSPASWEGSHRLRPAVRPRRTQPAA
ncbi:hypothetical protein GCM10012285_24300 [Streptomyces kronopolitis]|uniref:Uncharacterized protein n=1 Tax=Streptomyces kronopolitis TaxID=1612435 RepID=A0ABQ2JDN7_9ACTN|nr:hypothetical protein GCM10012285_24300 [Streptomyces kronopolitis]